MDYSTYGQAQPKVAERTAGKELEEIHGHIERLTNLVTSAADRLVGGRPEVVSNAEPSAGCIMGRFNDIKRSLSRLEDQVQRIYGSL